MRSGLSMHCFTRTRKVTASLPSTTRWSKDEVGYALADSKPCVIVVDDAFAGLVEDLTAADDQVRLIHTGDGEPAAGSMRYDALRRLGAPVTCLGGADEDVAGIFYTGGTTGHPKGVMLCHTGLITTLLAGKRGEEPKQDDEDRPVLRATAQMQYD